MWQAVITAPVTVYCFKGFIFYSLSLWFVFTVSGRMVVGGIRGETKGILSAINPPAARPVFPLSSSNELIKGNGGGATHLMRSVPHVNLLSESGRPSQRGFFFPLFLCGTNCQHLELMSNSCSPLFLIVHTDCLQSLSAGLISLGCTLCTQKKNQWDKLQILDFHPKLYAWLQLSSSGVGLTHFSR